MTAPSSPPMQLLCVRRTHGVLDREAIEIHCRHCSSKVGHPVIHRWSTRTGKPLIDRHEAAQKTA